MLVLSSAERGTIVSGKFHDYKGLCGLIFELYGTKIDKSALWISYTAQNGKVIIIKNCEDLLKAYTWAIYYEQQHVTFQIDYDESRDKTFVGIGFGEGSSAFLRK